MATVAGGTEAIEASGNVETGHWRGGETEHRRNGETGKRRIVRSPIHRFPDSPEEATGMLVPQGDAEAMADAIITLLTDDTLRMRLGENAARDAQKRFDLQRQVDDYLDWYAEILERHESKKQKT